MGNGGLPDDVAQFITRYIDSVEQLEVLLLLRGSAPREWTADDVAQELRINPISAGSRLETLAAQQLVRGSGGTYRFAPDSAQTEIIVRRLADTYAERRVSVITLIFSKPNDTIRSFADAFKIWKRDD